jgi:hypothetical protein
MREALPTRYAIDDANRHGVRFVLAFGYKEMAGMLMITRLSPEKWTGTIKLEGAVLQPWVSTVRDACSQRGRRKRLSLDLSAVSYVDAAGAQLLRDLMHEGIAITAWSRFVGELLHLEDSGKPGSSRTPESSPPPSAPSDRR